MSRRIAIVEDEAAIRENYADVLRKQGYEVQTYANRKDAMAAFDMRLPNLAIIDIGLENEIDGGFTLCQALRSMSETLPIIFLPARDNDFDTVSGLRMGADDYLTKPFSVAELSARVKALFRRVDAMSSSSGETSGPEELGELDTEGLRIDPARRRVFVWEQEVELTAREFDLLWHFASHPGRVFSRVQLLDKVWGYNHEGYEHTVNTHINRLRGKIEQDPARPEFIETVWGVGYRFRD